MRIDFQLFDLAVDKIKNPIAYYIDLLDDRLIYHLEAEIDKEPNMEAEEYEAKEDIYLCETRVYKRENIIGTTITFTKPYDDELYVVIVEIMGANESIEVTFNSKKAAHKFHKQILNYMFPKVAV